MKLAYNVMQNRTWAKNGQCTKKIWGEQEHGPFYHKIEIKVLFRFCLDYITVLHQDKNLVP